MTNATSLAPALAPPAEVLEAAPSSWTGSLLRRASVLLFLAALFFPAYYFAEDRYWLPLFSRYMALAFFAVSVDLIWGYCGLLSLGQGLYFGLGVYAVGYSLKLQQAATAAGMPHTWGPDMALPNFMEYCRLPAVPVWIAPLINIWVAFALAVIVPTLVASLFGLVTFRLRVKGVYFSLITQALLLAMFTLVDNQQPYTGGRVGMTNLSRLELFGHTFHNVDLYCLITGTLVVCFLICTAIVRSKFGRILTAIRDNENRVEALGYNTALYKTFVFGLAGGLAGLAGALYVTALRTAGPDRFAIPFSIEVVIMVAVGGRGTLVGAVLGSLLVSFADTYLTGTEATQKYWLMLLGSLFVVVVLFLPDGIVGWLKNMGARLAALLGWNRQSAT